METFRLLCLTLIVLAASIVSGQNKKREKITELFKEVIEKLIFLFFIWTKVGSPLVAIFLLL